MSLRQGLPPPQPPQGTPHLHVLPHPLPLITICTSSLAALGGLEEGGRVEEKLLIHGTGRSPVGSLYR